MKKSRNNVSDVVHGLTGKLVGPLELYETICGRSTCLLWLKIDDKEPITCMKCRSVLPRKKNK